jgi:hypothetical protein
MHPRHIHEMQPVLLILHLSKAKIKATNKDEIPNGNPTNTSPEVTTKGSESPKILCSSQV